LPVFASVSVFWRIANIYTFQQARNDYELHKKYGPVFRDGPNSVTISDPRALEPIYGVRNDLDKTTWYLVMEPDNSGEDYSVFSSRRAEQHRRLRKRIARTVRYRLLQYPSREGFVLGVLMNECACVAQYSMTTVMAYEPIIDRNIDDLLSWFKKLGTLDISVWTHYFTMDAS
jgi:hypothetical protein